MRNRFNLHCVILCTALLGLLVLSACDKLVKSAGSSAPAAPEAAGTAAASQAPANPAVPEIQPPADEEISVNLIYAGLSPSNPKQLDFDFKVLWGTYKQTSQQISVPVSAKKGRSSFDLGEVKLDIQPRIVSDVRGNYIVDVKDRSGKLIGSFAVTETGKQVELTQTGGSYEARLNYFHPERRLTGYTITKPGSREAQLGLIFVGKGWSFVENAKKPDLSKGYLFPEVDLVVLPKAWMDNNEMARTCDTLKAGEATGGGMCYS